MRRILVLIQGASASAEHGYVTAGATPKTDQKTSRLVFHLPEIA